MKFDAVTLQQLLSLILAFISTYLAIPFFIERAYRWNLMDKPVGRKAHARLTPIVGGICIFIGSVVGLLVSGISLYSMTWVLLALTILLVAGVIDDRIELSPGVKWLCQASAAGVLFAGGNYIQSFHGILGLPDLSPIMMIIISLVCITALINAVNLLDGMDGLLGGVAAINFLIFAIIFGMQGNVHDSLFALIIAVTLLAFLFFNFAPARIFMGDGGSLFLGGALAYCFTRLWNHPTQDKQLYLAIALISLPLFDMIRVFIYRLIRKRSPFIGDRSHFHHYLSKTGLHHAVSALIMYVFDMLLILQSILLSGFGLIEFAIANLLFFLLLFYIVREHSVFQDGKAWRRK